MNYSLHTLQYYTSTLDAMLLSALGIVIQIENWISTPPFGLSHFRGPVCKILPGLLFLYRYKFYILLINTLINEYLYLKKKYIDKVPA